MKSVRDADVKNKRVFLRVDFNVPMEEGDKITDTNRIKSSLLTIQYLIDHRAKIIIGTHLGKPGGKKDPALSTIPLAQELAKLANRRVYATDFVIEPEVKNQIDKMAPGDILLLGNLRWYAGEEANDEHFAKQLAGLADLYVNDAFGVSHRSAASLVGIANYLPSCSGLLLESEVTTFNLLLANPSRPFVVIIGGAKIRDKAETIEKLVEKADKIMLGGAVAQTFLAARGEKIGNSLFEPEMMPYCLKLMKKVGKRLFLPIDGIREIADLNDGFRIADIGPATIERYCRQIKECNTVFWNGNMGLSEDPRYRKGTEAIAKAIAAIRGTKVIAGGNTVGFVNSLGIGEQFSFVSTGGGATLKFIAGEKLPGIEALK